MEQYKQQRQEHHLQGYPAIEDEWLALEVEWRTEFKELKDVVLGKDEDGNEEEFDLITNLWDLDMAPYYRQLIEDSKFGWLPHMFLGNNGSTMASSYPERVNSAGATISLALLGGC